MRFGAMEKHMPFALSEDDVEILNRRLLAYLRMQAVRGPAHERIGPFLATFSTTNDNPFLNYAIPDDDAAPSADDIAALIGMFEAHRRQPRLEYIAAAAPKVEPMLLSTGFVAERRTPVMICTPGMEQDLPEIADAEIFLPRSDTDLTEAEQSQAEAYGTPPRGPGGLMRAIKGRGAVAAARDMASGMIVGAGTAMPPVDGISELAGIGVRAAFRRRGIAQALTAQLVHTAFAKKGVTLAWLTPEGPGAERVYARAGFAVASEALHISR
jgi:ribosomal protein S18 acetylase RimI-like enzyme